MREARRWCAAVVGAACVLAACSSEPEATAPTVELSTTVVTTLPPTTSTTEAPTTTEDPRIAEVEAAVAAFRTVQLTVLTDPATPLDLLQTVATGDLLENNTSAIQKLRAEGQIFSGDFVEVAIQTDLASDGSASHTACGIDLVESVSPDGVALEEPDDVALVRRYLLVADDVQGWLVASIEFPGSEVDECVI